MAGQFRATAEAYSLPNVVTDDESKESVGCSASSILCNEVHLIKWGVRGTEQIHYI